MFLVKVFTEGKKVVGKAFFFKERFVFIGTIIGMLLGFVSRVIIVRYITQSEYGIYSLALVLMSIFAMISTLGLQRGVTRQIAYFRGKKDSEKVSGIVKSSIQIDLKTISLYSTGIKNVVVM